MVTGAGEADADGAGAGGDFGVEGGEGGGESSPESEGEAVDGSGVKRQRGGASGERKGKKPRAAIPVRMNVV